MYYYSLKIEKHMHQLKKRECNPIIFLLPLIFLEVHQFKRDCDYGQLHGDFGEIKYTFKEVGCFFFFFLKRNCFLAASLLWRLHFSIIFKVNCLLTLLTVKTNLFILFLILTEEELAWLITVYENIYVKFERLPRIKMTVFQKIVIGL